MKNINRLMLIFMVLGGFVLDLKTVNAQQERPIDIGAVWGKVETSPYSNDDFIFYTPTNAVKIIRGFETKPQFYAKSPTGDCIIRNFKNPDWNVTVNANDKENNFYFESGGSVLTTVLTECGKDNKYEAGFYINVIRKWPFGFTGAELNLPDNYDRGKIKGAWVSNNKWVTLLKQHVYVMVKYKRLAAKPGASDFAKGQM